MGERLWNLRSKTRRKNICKLCDLQRINKTFHMERREVGLFAIPLDFSSWLKFRQGTGMHRCRTCFQRDEFPPHHRFRARVWCVSEYLHASQTWEQLPWLRIEDGLRSKGDWKCPPLPSFSREESGEIGEKRRCEIFLLTDKLRCESNSRTISIATDTSTDVLRPRADY